MYRTVEIAWTPSSAAQWQTFTSSRLEAARLWKDLVVRHARIRRFGQKMKWPSKSRWMAWAKKRYPAMSAQSAQQTVAEFLEAVYSTCQLRKKWDAAARYPWKTSKYRDVTYTNQGVRIHDGFLILSNGRKSNPLHVKLPRNIELPGRLMEVCVAFGRVRLICAPPDVVPVEPTVTIGVDLGVNTLIAAGDDVRGVLISGREAKATIQWRAKRLAGLSSAQSKKVKHSRRWVRLQHRKHHMLDKARNRVRDITHKATRIIADAFPNAKVVVGKPFNNAARKLGRKQAQQVSQACNAKIIAQLAYKLAGATEVNEAYTSQTCPVCGERRRVGRIYRCECGFVAPRDVVGFTNIRKIGLYGGMVPSSDVPRQIVRMLPHRKYPGYTQVVPVEPRQVAQRAA